MNNTTETPELRKISLVQKIVPACLLVFNIYLFFELIPDHIAEEYSILFAILGGIITMILAFWTADTLLRPLLKYLAIVSM